MINSKNPFIIVVLSLFWISTATQAEQQCKRDSIIATAPSSRYQQDTDGTVLDKETGLIWRRCLEGVTSDACDKGEPLALNWADALIHVSTVNSAGGFAGHNDWRLPNIREIQTLFELQCIDPAINLEIFPNTPSSQHWTSSPSHFIHEYAWYADFKTGRYTYLAGERTDAKHIRLVRDSNSPKE